MAIAEKYVEIFGATGSPGANSLPFYSDDKAPNGAWLLSEKSTPDNPIQKTLTNGTRLVMVDPALIPTTQEKASNTPLWECADGKAFFNSNGYCQVWLYQDEPLPNGKHGVPVVPGFQAWCKVSRLTAIIVIPPLPEPEPEPEPEPMDDLVFTELAGINIQFNPFTIILITKPMKE